MGDPLSIVAAAEAGTAIVAAIGFGPEQRKAIDALGVTLLVSASPGGPLLASLGLFSTPNVPPRTYYLRATAVNAFGSTVSREMPLSVPGGCPAPQSPLGFNAAVGPGAVTLSWSQTMTTGITF